MNYEPEAVEITDNEWSAAMRALGLDPIYDSAHDLDDLIHALRSTGSDQGNVR